MTAIDTSTLVNWIVSGFIGLVFGLASAWVTHRYQRKRDDIAWEREKEKLRQQIEHEKELLAVQLQQRMKELEQQEAQRQNSLLREELIKGISNPDEAIKGLRIITDRLRTEAGRDYLTRPGYLSALPLLERIEIALEEQNVETP